MPTCKEIAEKSKDFTYKEIVAAAKELGHNLPRGRGKTFCASADEAKTILMKASDNRKDRDAEKIAEKEGGAKTRT